MSNAEVAVVECGLVPYGDALTAQRALGAARLAEEIPDTLLLLQHPPVYTRGRRFEPSELPMGEQWYAMQGIEVVEADRGGSVTYHGPGQLVAYPIVSLRPYRDDVHDFVARLEKTMISALADAGLGAGVIVNLTGVWTASGEAPPPDATADNSMQAIAEGRLRKIGSIGIHISRGVTTHGLAVNVSNDLQPFEWVVPCGIEGCRMTSLTREFGAEQDPVRFGRQVAARLAEIYERAAVGMTIEELVASVPGAAGLAGSVP